MSKTYQNPQLGHILPVDLSQTYKTHFICPSACRTWSESPTLPIQTNQISTPFKDFNAFISQQVSDLVCLYSGIPSMESLVSRFRNRKLHKLWFCIIFTYVYLVIPTKKHLENQWPQQNPEPFALSLLSSGDFLPICVEPWLLCSCHWYTKVVAKALSISLGWNQRSLSQMVQKGLSFQTHVGIFTHPNVSAVSVTCSCGFSASARQWEQVTERLGILSPTSLHHHSLRD